MTTTLSRHNQRTLEAMFRLLEVRATRPLARDGSRANSTGMEPASLQHEQIKVVETGSVFAELTLPPRPRSY